MLSYQHGYHAGNFADVIKHSILTAVMNYMIQKDKALFYLETHAGRGLYDLQDAQAKKTAEFQKGIGLFWEQEEKAPPFFDPYIAVIKSLNNQEGLRYYPGSPYLALALLRQMDRIYCTELHSREFSYLEQLPSFGKRVFFKQADGLAEMASLLPPMERRGLVFIDPSFELKDEYKKIPRLLNAMLKRFATGVFALWYPILDDEQGLRQLMSGLSALPTDKFLRIEFYLNDLKEKGMKGSGFYIINPPYALAEGLKAALQFLSQVFNPGKSSFLITHAFSAKER